MQCRLVMPVITKPVIVVIETGRKMSLLPFVLPMREPLALIAEE
jgi:hypothetical protein